MCLRVRSCVSVSLCSYSHERAPLLATRAHAPPPPPPPSHTHTHTQVGADLLERVVRAGGEDVVAALASRAVLDYFEQLRRGGDVALHVGDFF